MMTICAIINYTQIIKVQKLMNVFPDSKKETAIEHKCLMAVPCGAGSWDGSNAPSRI